MRLITNSAVRRCQIVDLCIYANVSLGVPLSDLQTLPERSDGFPLLAPASRPARTVSSVEHSPSSISFVRSRMLYARAALNAQGGVRFGLRHIRGFFKSIIAFCSNLDGY
jgi:hypothetical protein